MAIVTEWNEFRGLDVARMKKLLKAPVLVDLRNVYDPKDMRAAGFHYTCVGRGTDRPARAASEAAQLSVPIVSTRQSCASTTSWV